MARTSSSQSKIYVDQYDYSGLINTVEQTMDVDLQEVTAPDDAGITFVEGKYKGQLVINGFFDPSDDAYDEIMWSALGSGADHYLGWYPGQDASYADIGFEHICRVKGEPRNSSIAGAILLHVTWEGTEPVVRATVLCNGAATQTGAVTNSNQNLGATTAGEEFVAVLRVLAVSGTGSITVKVQESQNDGSPDTYADLIAFTAATAVGVERKSVITATEAWKRVNVTAFSGFTSVTIMVSCGKEQGVD